VIHLLRENYTNISEKCTKELPVTYAPIISRLIIASTLTELFRYVCAKFSAPNSPCSSPAKAAKAIEAFGLYVAKIRASSNDTATPDALELC
jgi:hypothetical protein